MKKYFVLFIFLLAPLLSCAASEVKTFMVTDVLNNIFTIKGMDFYWGEDRDAFPMQVGDELIVLQEDVIPLADESYSILIELATKTGDFKKSFLSTIMNDHQLAHVKEQIIHEAKVREYTKRNLMGEDLKRYSAQVAFTILLEDGASYYIWYGTIADTSNRKEAEEALEAFCNQKPSIVRIEADQFAQVDEKGDRSYWVKIHYLDDSLKSRYSFLGKGDKRKRISEKDLDKFEIKFCRHEPCKLCGRRAWQLQFYTLSSHRFFSFVDHGLAHDEYNNPSFYSNGTNQTQVCSWVRLIQVEDDSYDGRIFIFEMLPHGRRISLYCP